MANVVRAAGQEALPSSPRVNVRVVLGTSASVNGQRVRSSGDSSIYGGSDQPQLGEAEQNQFMADHIAAHHAHLCTVFPC